jgi:acyl carrier protein
MEENRRRLQDVLKDVLNVTEVPPHASREDFPEWDSVAFLTIVARVEAEFNIEATHKNIRSFGSIDGILTELQKTGTGK